MAGPLSSEEIEDVVSSVRRLVSNELRPKALSRDLNADRLLLTPGLRVMPENSALAPLVLDAPLLLTNPVVDPGPISVANESADPVSAQSPDADRMTNPGDAVVDPAPMVDDRDAEYAAAVWDDQVSEDLDVTSPAEAALVADEAEVLTAPADPVPPETASEPSAAPSGDELGPDGSSDDPVPFVAKRRRGPRSRIDPAPSAEGSPADLAAAETDTLPSATPSSGLPIYRAQDPLQRQAATGLWDEDGTPLAVLDETALHDIVRDILRTELQGELGERITRNVRKLVRAEINRALIARDLD